MDCLKSVPVDKCCLVVQMPTVEEMKREVADITCEMQSVYIDDSARTLPATSTDTNTRPAHSSHFYKNQSACNINEVETHFTDNNYKTTLNHKTPDYDTKFGSLNLQHSDNHLHHHNSSDSRWSTMEDIGGNGEEQETTEGGLQSDPLENATEFKLNRFGSMLVSHKNTNENLLSKFISPSVNSSTSSGPREEQVSEEFIIDGKRYRQVYQRRVVLERKTTRDVFFLPGNNTETDLRTSNKNHYEYKSPNYDKQLSSQVSDESPLNNSKSSPNDFIINRPGLDLTVLHTRNNSADNEPCLSPAIILRSGNGTPNNYKGGHNSACSKCQTSSITTSTLNNNSNTSNGSHQLAETVKRLSISDVNKTGRRTRNIVRSLSNSLKRSVSAGIQRTRSLVKSVPGKSKMVEGNQRPQKKLSKVINNDVSEKDRNDKNDQEVNDTRSKQIMGYMYKFGVWDDQQPVLDPRLPVFFDLTAENGSNGLNGTVIPTAPEWHHAEVGLENIEQFQGAYVRSRTVACLQRFTQRSSASGKALHRSTYVQQTRLVRQLNRSGERKKDNSQTETEDNNKNRDLDHEEKVSNSTPTHLLTDPCVFDTNQFAKYDMRSEDCLHSTVEDNSARFVRCSNDRLQLLQSLCPSAAAATILLGKPMHDSQDNDDTNQENQFINTPNYSDETRVLVTANAWCPVSLRTKDPNSQLVFNSTNKENNGNGNVGSKSNSPKHSPSSMSVPEPTIRGGTLDGLLIYALNLLQSPIPSSHPDYLFPDVIRLMYPTFTTLEKVTERLIQIYVAYAPVEPGCQSSDWIDALTAADYLVTIATDIHPNQLSASLILRLNRFARLLMYDNQIISSALDISNEQAQSENPISQEPHRLLANRLLEKFPLFSSKQKLTNQVNGRYRTNSNRIQTNLDELSKKSMTMNNSSVRQNDRNSVEKVKRSSLQYPSLINDDIDLCITEPRRDAIQRASEFLEYDARSIAQEITQIEEEKFAEIEFQELLDIPHLEKGEAHSLARCVEHFNQITRWAKGMIFILAPNLLEKCSTLGSYHHEKINQKRSLFENFWSCHTSTASSNEVVKDRNKLQNDDATRSNVEVTITTNNEDDDSLPKVNTFNKNFTLLSSQHKDISVKKIISLNIMLLKMCEVLKNFTTSVHSLHYCWQSKKCLNVYYLKSQNNWLPHFHPI
uniref:Ras-GEF domain-containing protein n=1 Tax=Trichobilharzia regenti TaxID=157069 RepID=A0AA85K5W5_TRIRE|nr:unnamed protein product [Trichobilharzia regenti]